MYKNNRKYEIPWKDKSNILSGAAARTSMERNNRKINNKDYKNNGYV